MRQMQIAQKIAMKAQKKVMMKMLFKQSETSIAN
jgi:hypothetical protein